MGPAGEAARSSRVLHWVIAVKVFQQPFLHMGVNEITMQPRDRVPNGFLPAKYINDGNNIDFSSTCTEDVHNLVQARLLLGLVDVFAEMATELHGVVVSMLNRRQRDHRAISTSLNAHIL